MGGGGWSAASYSAYTTAKAASGRTTFDYHDTMTRTVPHSSWKAHDTLNPLGVKLRECHDSADHPTAFPVVVYLDVTGSMSMVVHQIHGKLDQLMGLLLRKDYVTDPQIMFGGIGDATCDAVPLQVGQFESDVRIAQDLENLVIEGGGGGNPGESYELAMYFIARHTSTDAWEKRGVRGYFFIIGDEPCYPKVKAAEVQKVIGDTLQGDIPTEQIVKELQERYHVFYIMPKGASNGGDRRTLEGWKKLLGQNVLELDDPAAVCETIALAIGMSEGTLDGVDSGMSDLLAMGSTASAARAAATATAHIPATAVAVASGSVLPEPATSGGTTRRL